MTAQKARGTDRLLDILSFFETHAEASSRNALAVALNCPRSTIYALVDRLIDKGWLVQTGAGVLRLGYRAGLLGLTYTSQEPFESAAREVIQRVAAETGEVAEINVIENWRQLVLISASGRGMSYLRIVEGCRYPLPLTASARVQLAHLPANRIQKAIPVADFQTAQGETIAFQRFIAEIEAARDQGFALAKGLMDPFFGSISVPIRATSGKPIAAVSLVLPVPQIDERHNHLVQILRRTAVELERLLHIKGWPMGEALLHALNQAPAEKDSHA